MAELGEKLGKLSLAILENFVEGVVGKKFVDELRVPTDRVVAIESALEHTEKRFVEEFSDKKFAEKILTDTSDDDLGLLFDAIDKFFKRPTDKELHTVLLHIIKTSNSNVSERECTLSTDQYIDIFTEELMFADAEFREKVRGLTDKSMLAVLSRIEKSVRQQSTQSSQSQAIEQAQLILDGNFAEFDDTRQAELIAVLAALLHVDIKNIKVLKVSAGSIVIDLEMERVAIARLVKLIKENDFRMIKLGILSIRLGDGEFVSLGNDTDSSQAISWPSFDGTQVAVGDINVGGNVGGSVVLGSHNTIKIMSEQPVFRTLHQLPQPPRDFTGREELIDQLLEDFKSHKGATISGLTGMGGIGKTALGLMVAHKIAYDYPEAQIFLDLKGTTTPLSAVEIARHVILAFEPTADLIQLDEASVFAAYQSVLYEKKILLFFDNARSAEQIVPLIPPDTCAVLITSRWVFSVPGLRQHRLDIMEEGEAKDFLLELCPRIKDNTMELANACVYLPLALRIVGSYLQVNDHLSAKKYLNELTDRTNRLHALEATHDQSNLSKEQPNLIATFELSYNQLSEEDQSRWRVLGVFPASFAATAASAMWKTEENETDKLLGLFRRYSLINYDEASYRYTMHDLLADYAIDKLSDRELILARLNHSVHYSKLLTSINQDFIKGGDNISRSLRIYDIELLNIEVGQQVSVEYLEDWRDAIDSCNNFALQGSINGFRQKPRDRIRWLENGLKASKMLDNKEHIGAHLGNLGAAYAELGYTKKAIEFYELQREIAFEIGDHYVEGNATGNLATEYLNFGDTSKAIELFEQALAITRGIGDRLYEGGWLNSLGNVYAKTGYPDRAIEFYNQSLKVAHEIGDHLGENLTLGNLGNVFSKLGNYSKAIEYYEQVLSFHREVNDRHGEELILGNLGVAYAELGNVSKAIVYFKQALEITREVGRRRDEHNWLFNLAVSYKELGEFRTAINFYEQMLMIERELDDLVSEVETLGNLGLSYVALGEAQKAFEAFEKQLKLARKIENREIEGKTIANMGLALFGMGKKDEGISLVEQAVKILDECESYLAENTRQALKDLREM